MQVISDNLKCNLERWDDPGDYPSGAGSGPLASYDYVCDVEGQMVVELEHRDFERYLEPDGTPIDEDDIRTLLSEFPGDVPTDLPHGTRVTKWRVVGVAGMRATLEVESFEAGEVERDYPDYDYDDCDDDIDFVEPAS
jgi:hypothetical protein